MKTLRDKLEARIQATIEAIERDRTANVVRCDLPATDGLDPAELAGIVATEIQRYADALIADKLVRKNVLLDDALAAQWPICPLYDEETSTEPDKRLAHVGDYEVRSGRVYSWHPKVSHDQAGQLLDRIATKDPLAARVSMLLTAGRYTMRRPLSPWVSENTPPSETPHFMVPNFLGLPPSLFGLPEDERELEAAVDERAAEYRLPEHEREVGRVLAFQSLMFRACFVAERAWYSPSVTVLAYVESKVLREAEDLREVQKRHVRAPCAVITSILASRSTDFSIETKIRPDPTGRTFTAPDDPGLRAWVVEPPRGLTMSLPLDHDLAERTPFAAVRDALGANMLRFYLADWYLVGEQGNASGLHTVDDAYVLGELLGYSPGKTTSKGKPYTRPKPKHRQMLDDFYWCAENTLLLGIGKVRFNPPDPLVSPREITHASGRKGIAYVPAPFAMQEFTKRFMQVPLAALRLGAHRTELAMGVASVVRGGIESCLTAGCLSMPLRQWATRAGEPIAARLRRDGRGYWTTFRKELAEVIERGAFGRVHFGPGDGETVIATFEPGADIGRVYSGMLARITGRRELAQSAALEAEVRRLEEKNPQPGRPRKRKAR